jgi:hypothetical protein
VALIDWEMAGPGTRLTDLRLRRASGRLSVQTLTPNAAVSRAGAEESVSAFCATRMAFPRPSERVSSMPLPPTFSAATSCTVVGEPWSGGQSGDGCGNPEAARRSSTTPRGSMSIAVDL